MAKKWTNKILPGALHYVTCNVLDRKRIFKLEENCIAFLEELQDLRAQEICKLIAFVVMLDHVHFVINPRDGNVQAVTGVLKSLSAKRLVELAPTGYYRHGEGSQVWQESFKSLPLWSGWMISQKINYIHSNPVRAGISDSAESYRWTSFRSIYCSEEEPLLQVDKEWWWPGDLEKLAKILGEEELERERQIIEKRG